MSTTFHTVRQYDPAIAWNYICDKAYNLRFGKSERVHAGYIIPYRLNSIPDFNEVKRAVLDGYGEGYKLYSDIQIEPPVEWHNREQNKYKLHPVIKKALAITWCDNLDTLVMEWPHISEGDATKLAYTRSPEHGVADRQTVTTVGKYLRRHFPTLTDHSIRDLAAVYAATECKFIDNIDSMIDHLQRGPDSCMVWEDDDDVDDHPYRVYAPEYGWRLAVNMQGNDVIGRALVNVSSERKIYVRSYHKPVDGGRSHSDHGLEAWLNSQGFTRASGWEGCKLKYMRGINSWGSNYVVAPYIDGDCQQVVICGNHLEIVDQGDYLCNNTDGRAEELEDQSECECCNERYHDDHMRWVGRNEDTHVCEGCVDYSYVTVRGANREYYILPQDDAVLVGDYWYDTEYLEDNDIVQTYDGDYERMDECVCTEDGDWYLYEDDRVVGCADGEYRLRDECWKCEESGDWYSNDEDSVTLDDGRVVHPDNAPEEVTI